MERWVMVLVLVLGSDSAREPLNGVLQLVEEVLTVVLLLLRPTKT